MELVELRPLKPFCGSYRCHLNEADTVDDAWEEREDGAIVRTRVPRKRYVGLIPVVRHMTNLEVEAVKAGQALAANLEVIGERTVRELPESATVSVPEDIAASLIQRGLAERVTASALLRREAGQ